MLLASGVLRGGAPGGGRGGEEEKKAAIAFLRDAAYGAPRDDDDAETRRRRRRRHRIDAEHDPRESAVHSLNPRQHRPNTRAMSFNKGMLAVGLRRDFSATPWGFRLQGGYDLNAPLTIQR
ncbi:PDZ domain protein, partial [Ixodes scapularis]